MHFSVIIPTYNEAKNVERTACALLSRLRETKCDFEIIFSDDGSSDRSAEIISSLAKENPELRLICSEKNKGKGHAVRQGLSAAEGELAVFTDCDLAYGAEPIFEIIEKLRVSDCGICIGSRSLHQSGYAEYPFFRRFASRVYMKILKAVADFKYSDSQCGIKGFKRSVCAPIFEKCIIDGFAFDLEILMLADSMGITVCEIPVRVLSNDSKDSKVHVLRDAFKMLCDVRKIKKALISEKGKIVNEI